MNKIGQNDNTGTETTRTYDPVVLSMKFFGLKIATLYLMLTYFLGAAFGQAEGPEIRIDTKLAAFEVTVTNEKGEPIRGLTANDFRVYDNGTERGVDFFQPIKTKDAGRPLTIVFALDVSGSMTEMELQRLRDAMQDFVGKLADYESTFSVMSFAMEVKNLQGFTNRKDRLEQAFGRLRRDQDGLSTHAYDAVDQAIREIARKAPKAIRNKFPRRAVILITDGFPVGDIVSPQTVIERANAAETSIYSVLLPSFSRIQRDNRRVITPLEASGISERTGGLSVIANQSNFQAIFDSLAEELTASYAIAFYPNDARDPGIKRPVRIVSKKGFTVRQNRDGYVTGN